MAENGRNPVSASVPRQPGPARGSLDALRSVAGRLLPRTVRGTQLLLLLVVLVPLLLVQSSIYYNRFTVRRAQELQANLELARSVAGTFDAYVQDVVRQELSIGISFLPQDPSAAQHVREHMIAGVREYPSVRNFNWVDLNGRVTVSSDPEGVGIDVSDRPYFREILAGREWVVSDLLR